MNDREVIEYSKFIFHAAGELFSAEDIQNSHWDHVFQLVVEPSFWGEPHVLSLIDDGRTALMSYATLHIQLQRNERSRAARIWHEQLRKALRENTEFPDGLPDDIIITHDTVLLTENQRSWFLERMMIYEQHKPRDYGQPQEFGRGEPYILYGQYFSNRMGFQCFYDWDFDAFTLGKQFRDILYFLALSVFKDMGTLNNLLKLKEGIWTWPHLREEHVRSLNNLIQSQLESTPLTAQSIAFDRAAEYYDDTRGFPPGIEQDAALTIVRAGNLNASSRILEVGIGTGRIALPLAQHVGEVHGLDLSPAMMLRLRSKQRDEPIHLAQGDATRLPYADHSFDGAVGVHILHLIPGWQSVLQELIRVLKPDAPFIQCWSRNEEVFKSLWAAWRSAIPEQEAADVGLGFDKNEPTMHALGWRVATEQTFAYSYGRSPAVFIRQLENRVWSRTWRLTDESLAAGVAAVKAAVARDYPNAEAPVTVHEQFVAKAYYPPQ